MEAKDYKKAVTIAKTMIEQKYDFAEACEGTALLELQTQEKNPDELAIIAARISELLKI
jgi:hypothetical protein